MTVLCDSTFKAALRSELMHKKASDAITSFTYTSYKGSPSSHPCMSPVVNLTSRAPSLSKRKITVRLTTHIYHIQPLNAAALSVVFHT